MELKKLNDKELIEEHAKLHKKWEETHDRECESQHEQILQEMKNREIDHQYTNELDGTTKLSDILGYFKHTDTGVYVAGEIVESGETSGDIDVFINLEETDPIAQIHKFRTLRAMPENLRERLNFHFKPETFENVVPVYLFNSTYNEDINIDNPEKYSNKDLIFKHALIHSWWNRIKKGEKVDSLTATEVKKMHSDFVKEMEKRNIKHDTPLLSLKYSSEWYSRNIDKLPNIEDIPDDKLSIWHARAHSLYSRAGTNKTEITKFHNKIAAKLTNHSTPISPIHEKFSVAGKTSKIRGFAGEAESPYETFVYHDHRLDYGTQSIVSEQEEDDKGIIELGFSTDNYKEFWLHGEKFKGRYIYKDSKLYKPEDTTPYVFSDEGKDFVPEFGISYLPKEIEDLIPIEYQYWNEKNDAKRVEIKRALLDAIDRQEIKLSQSTFELYKQGDHYLLNINYEKYYYLADNPVDVDETFIVKADALPSDCEPICAGDVDIYGDKYDFHGKKFSGLWVIDGNAFKKHQLPEEGVLYQVKLSGDIVTGVGAAPGVWNGYYYSQEVIDNAPWEQIRGAPITIEHRKEEGRDGVVQNFWRDEHGGVHLDGVLESVESREKTKHRCGYSMEWDILVDKVRRVVLSIDKIKKVTLTEHPACKVCWLDN